MPLQLYDLPFDMLEMIGEFYDDLAQREAASTLQAALQRHLLTRCDDPRHTARTNTPGEGPLLCYQSCHNHPKRVFCRATRAEYFASRRRAQAARAWLECSMVCRHIVATCAVLPRAVLLLCSAGAFLCV